MVRKGKKMKRYIRTKDGKIIDTEEIITINGTLFCGDDKFNNKAELLNEIIKQADTIEELIKDYDCLYIKDLYDDMVLVVESKVKPFGYNEPIKVKEFLKLTSCRELELYTKQGNNYILVTRKENGEWRVI